MNKTEKLIQRAKKRAEIRIAKKQHIVYGKMTTEQLKELAFGEPSVWRIEEIFDSAGGLHLLR